MGRFIRTLAAVGVAVAAAGFAKPAVAGQRTLPISTGHVAIYQRVSNTFAGDSVTVSGCYRASATSVVCAYRADTSLSYCTGLMIAWASGGGIYTRGLGGGCHTKPLPPPTYTPPPIYTPPTYTPPPIYTPPTYTPPDCPAGWYVNAYGQCIPGPSPNPYLPVPGGPTAICMDGTYSYSQTRSGSCSYHGGVETWLGP